MNNRGSSGYGKTFFTADDRKHGYEPLWDCVEAKKFLYSLGYIAAGEVGIMGAPTAITWFWRRSLLSRESSWSA